MADLYSFNQRLTGDARHVERYADGEKLGYAESGSDED
jgi:hypothetical protein